MENENKIQKDRQEPNKNNIKNKEELQNKEVSHNINLTETNQLIKLIKEHKNLRDNRHYRKIQKEANKTQNMINEINKDEYIIRKIKEEVKAVNNDLREAMPVPEKTIPLRNLPWWS